MPNTTTTPNMNLVLPDVLAEPGPQFASDVNGALETVDAHDHTTGNELPIRTAALYLDAGVNLNPTGSAPQPVQNSQYLQLSALGSQPSDIIRELYCDSSGNLWWVNASGTAVQLTSGSGSGLNTGNITGLVPPASAVFSGVTFTWSASSPFYPATMASGPVSIYPQTSGATNAVQILAPSGLAASYGLTLPTGLPTSKAVMEVSGAGGMTLPLVPQSNISSSSGNYSAVGNAADQSLGTSVTLSVIGTRATVLTIAPDASANVATLVLTNADSSAHQCTFKLYRGGTAVQSWGFLVPASGTLYVTPPSFVDTSGTSGSITYALYVNTNSNVTVAFAYWKLFAQEQFS
jgi:hypothetical protein